MLPTWCTPAVTLAMQQIRLLPISEQYCWFADVSVYDIFIWPLISNFYKGMHQLWNSGPIPMVIIVWPMALFLWLFLCFFCFCCYLYPLWARKTQKYSLYKITYLLSSLSALKHKFMKQPLYNLLSLEYFVKLSGILLLPWLSEL